MSKELKKEITCWYKKRLTPEQEELQRKAEIEAKALFDTIGFDPKEEKKLYKNVVDYLKEPGADSNKLIAEITGEVLYVAIKQHLAEKHKPKKLPNIAVIGDFWELAPIETLLIWEGYDMEDACPDDDIEWNYDIINDCFREEHPIPVKMIVANGDVKTILYHNHNNPFKNKAFNVSEPEKILQYIHDFNK